MPVEGIFRKPQQTHMDMGNREPELRVPDEIPSPHWYHLILQVEVRKLVRACLSR